MRFTVKILIKLILKKILEHIIIQSNGEKGHIRGFLNSLTSK